MNTLPIDGVGEARGHLVLVVPQHRGGLEGNKFHLSHNSTGAGNKTPRKARPVREETAELCLPRQSGPPQQAYKRGQQSACKFEIQRAQCEK